MGGADTTESQWELSTYAAPPDSVTSEQIHRLGRAAASPQYRMILQSVLMITSAGGYGALSAGEIIRTSGVSRRGFNAWFGTAEEAFVAAHDQCMDQMVRAIRTAIDDDGVPEAQLRRGLRAVVEYLVADPARADAMLIEVHAAGQRALRSHEAAVEQIVTEARGVLLRAGLESDLAWQLARFGIGALREAIRARMARGELHTLPHVVEELVDAAFPLRVIDVRGPVESPLRRSVPQSVLPA